MLKMVTAAALLVASAALGQPMTESITRLETELTAKYGETQRPRITRGLRQVADFWRPGDGDAATFEAFVRTNFAGDQKTLDALFDRMMFGFESLDGHMLEINRDWRWQSDLDLGTVHPFDEIMAAWNSSRMTMSKSLSSGSLCRRAVRIPSVATRSRVRSEKRRSKRICHPISSPIRHPCSAAIRRASARAATLRGCRRITRPSFTRAGGTRVVLPDPGGATMTAALRSRMVSTIRAM